jgi:hypothetical protein
MGNWPYIATEGPVVSEATFALDARGKKSPECHLGTETLFVLPNFNFYSDKETLMSAKLEMYQLHNFKQIGIERGALIDSGEWLHELLTHISDSGTKTIDIVAKASSFISSVTKEWDEPSISKVQKEGACLMTIDQRPEVLKMNQVRLTKGMIDALNELMTSASHGVSFELTLRK